MERMLEQSLGRVAAPRELWDRVEMPRAEQRVEALPRWAWAAAAAVLVLASAWGLRETRIESSNAGEIRAWIAANTGLDLPLYSQPPAGTRLVGARLLSEDRAEIALMTGSQWARLVVEGTPGATEGHGTLGPGVRTATWVLRGQRYTLECPTPEALTAACRLCHG